MTVRIAYQKQLDTLTNYVKESGHTLLETIDLLLKVIYEQDRVAARNIIEVGRKYQRYEHEMEAACIQMVLMQQPVAGDWRRIAAVMRIFNNISTIARYCAEISHYAMLIADKKELVPVPAEMEHMFYKMRALVAEGLQYFETEEGEKAAALFSEDNEVDEAFVQVRESIAALMKEEPDHIPQYMDYFMIAKYIERIADMAADIGDWVVYMVKAQRLIREHGATESL